MVRLSSVLWNGSEGRPRALWRVVLVVVLYAAMQVVANSFHPVRPGPRDAVTLWLQQPLTWLAPAAGALAGLWLLARFVSRERLAAFGLRPDRDWLVDLGFGLALALLLNGAVFFGEWSLGWVRITGLWHSGIPSLPYGVAVLSPLLAMALISLVQDPLLRAYPIRSLSQGLVRVGARTGVLLATAVSVALLFAIFMVMARLRGARPPNAVAPIDLAMASIAFAVPYVLTGRLGLTIGLHLAWDFSLANVYGFPVAGMARAGITSLFVTRQSHENVWTGPAAFGPTGGLLETAAFLVAIGLTLLYVRLRYGGVEVDLVARRPAGATGGRPVATASDVHPGSVQPSAGSTSR